MATKKQCDEYAAEIQAHVDGDVLRGMVRTMLQNLIEEEMTQHIGAGAYERSPERTMQRNGYKPRKVKTRVGEIALDIPQVRCGEPYHPSMFARWQRSERALLVACAEMYFLGVSTRKVVQVLEEMGGFSLSAGTVSRIAMELDEPLAEFRERRLDGHVWPYLVVDACYLKVRRNKKIVPVAVLVVAGVNELGDREILAWRLGDTESEETWGEVFRDLKRRGLKGVELLVSDGHEGIQAAAAKQFSGVAWQRCWVHFLRNAMKKVSYKHYPVLLKELRALYKIENAALRVQEVEAFAQRWEAVSEKLARQVREQFEECVTVEDLPPEHQRKLRTTNLLERVMEEIKRRTRVVGIFPNDAACERLVGARLVEIHEDWEMAQKAYLNMELGLTTTKLQQ
jgi:transposase-like protein